MTLPRRAAPFAKWHALGNAYLVLERDEANPLTAARVKTLCDPESGIGSHGVLEVSVQSATEALLAVWNPDGSVAEMSGNGVRIAARWLAERAGVEVVTIATGGRSVRVTMLSADETEQEMGEVTVGATSEFAVADQTVVGTVAQVGNPHLVVRLDGATVADLRVLGPALETHAAFPERTNVQLVEPRGRHVLRVLVWERGAGETPSSGSSATAAAAVAVAHGWCVSPVDIELPGGTLRVALTDTGATLTGPAVELCRGEVYL